MYHNFLIHSSADGHLHCFHVLAIVIRAAVNTRVHVSLSILFSLRCMPSSGIARSYGSSRASLVAQSVKNLPAMQETLVRFLGWEDLLEKGKATHFSFPGGSDGKESSCNVGDLGSILELGRSPGRGDGHPLQYSCLENSLDRESWRAAVHGVTKSWIQLSD